MSATAVDSLRSEMGGTLVDAVDVLHVAAFLESSGITDDLARTRYGHDDVFALAATLHSADVAQDAGPEAPARPSARSATAPPDPPTSAPGPGASTVGHGLIYLLPALSMPALLHLVGTRHTVLALVVGAAVGWLWAVVATWHAYRVYGLEGRAAAAADLRANVLAGVVAGLVVGVVAGAATEIVVGVVAASVTAAQLGTTLLFFLGRRLVLAGVLLVQAVVGAGHLLAPGRVPAWGVLLLFAAGAVLLLVAGHGRHAPRRPRILAPGLRPVMAYAFASVLFLLLPQAQFLGVGAALPLPLAALFLTMGYVEWRGGAVSARLRDALASTTSPGQFRRTVLTTLRREAASCAAVTACATLALGIALERLGLLTRGVMAVGAATVLLSAAYLLALVLANTGAYTWLASSFAGGALVQTVLTVSAGASVSTAFVAATGVLLVALQAGLAGRPVTHFR